MLLTVPEPPQSVIVTTLSSTSIMVEWEVPICDNGQRMGYSVSAIHMLPLHYT